MKTDIGFVAGSAIDDSDTDFVIGKSVGFGVAEGTGFVVGCDIGFAVGKDFVVGQELHTAADIEIDLVFG